MKKVLSLLGLATLTLGLCGILEIMGNRPKPVSRKRSCPETLICEWAGIVVYRRDTKRSDNGVFR